MNKKHCVVIPVVVSGSLFLFFDNDEDTADQEVQTSAKSSAASKGVSLIEEDIAFVEGETVTDLSAHYFQEYGSEGQHPRQDLEELAMLFQDYRTVAGSAHPLPTDGNREIVDFLAGENPSGFRYLSRSSAVVNVLGELIDRWEKPLYFHFVSSEEIEIRSAGSDGEMWTGDDLLVGQSESSSHLTSQ